MPPSAGPALLDQLQAERLVAEVARHRDRLAAGGLDERHDLLRVGLFGRQVVQHQVGALAGEGDRDRAADAAIRAGDDGAAALKAAEPAIALLAVVGLRVHVAREAGRRLRLILELRLRILLRRVLHRVLVLR